MKQHGAFITGDSIRVNDYTADWFSVRLHPGTFYRRYEQFSQGFSTINGLYTVIDLGQFVSVRFSEKDDLTSFHRLHHKYI